MLPFYTMLMYMWPPGAHAVIQRDLVWLEKWANRNFMKFNQRKCKVLHPEKINPEAKTCGYDTAMGACSLESQTHPGLQQRQQIKRGDSPPLHHSCETSPGALHPPLGSSISHWILEDRTIGVEKCHKKFCNVRETHNKILKDKVRCGDIGRNAQC